MKNIRFMKYEGKFEGNFMSYDPAIKANKELFLAQTQQNQAFKGETNNSTGVSTDGAKLPSQPTQDGFVSQKKKIQKGIIAAIGTVIIGTGVYLLTKGKNKKVLTDGAQEVAEQGLKKGTKKAVNEASQQAAENKGFLKKTGDFLQNLFAPSNSTKVDDVAKQNIDEGMDSINNMINDMPSPNDIAIDSQNTQRIIDAYDEEAAQVLEDLKKAAEPLGEPIPTKIDDVVAPVVDEAAIAKEAQQIVDESHENLIKRTPTKKTAATAQAAEESVQAVKTKVDTPVKPVVEEVIDHPPISEASQVPMHHYVNGHNVHYRRALEDPQNSQKVIEKMKVIDAEFDKLPPLDKEYTFYRGRGEHPIAKSLNGDFPIVNNAKVGDVIVPDKAYSYTAFDKKLAKGWAQSDKSTIMYEIKAPKGSKISCNLEHGGEALFPRGAEYRVLSKTVDPEKAHTDIVLEYIIPDKAITKQADEGLKAAQVVTKAPDSVASIAKKASDDVPDRVISVLNKETGNVEKLSVKKGTSKHAEYSLNVYDDAGKRIGIADINSKYDGFTVALPDAYECGENAFEIKFLGTASTHKGVGTQLVKAAVEASDNAGLGGRVCINASGGSLPAKFAMVGKKSATSPVPFYYKAGFRFKYDDLNEAVEAGIKSLEAGGKYTGPPEGAMFLPDDAIRKILGK